MCSTRMDDMKEFEKLLEDAPVLLDGATGTNLMAAGMPRGCCVEAWMLAHEDAVIRLQSAYAAAGSRIIYAPTFTAQPGRLARFGQDEQTEEINARLVWLSRKAAPDCLIAGSMATMVGIADVRSKAGFEEAVSQYRRQIDGLLAGGADVLIGETLMSKGDALAILQAAGGELPVLLSFTLDTDGRLRSGEETQEVFAELEESGALALGVNCIPADEALPALVRRMKTWTALPLLVKPNAGRPRNENGSVNTYPINPVQFADVLLDCAEEGAALLGGCCGTTPEYIALLARRMSLRNKDERSLTDILSD